MLNEKLRGTENKKSLGIKVYTVGLKVREAAWLRRVAVTDKHSPTVYTFIPNDFLFSVPLSFSFNTHSYSVNFTHHICPISNFEKRSFLTYSNVSAQTDQFILIFLI